ncbi:MAG TPA: twin-arginine translocase TatA/TatE family subunit [Candidatus Saccharimonadales bacterium]|jgi:sec-independent protein translocase protein TatA|nr:twin-arginine translocase TatA/TatE family subunit [Candidatus Saccharimonadales bacterium]
MGKVEGLLILLAIILILFGAKKLPELARGVGESVRELKKGLSDNEPKVSKKASSEEK